MDIDAKCEEIAYNMNKDYEIAISDMLAYEDYDKHNLIINTVCEHMTQEQYNEWIDKDLKEKNCKKQRLFCEHVNCKQTLEDEDSRIWRLLCPTENISRYD